MASARTSRSGFCVACVKKKDNTRIYACTEKKPAKWLCSVGRMVIPSHSATFKNIEAGGFRDTAPSRADLRITLTPRSATTTDPKPSASRKRQSRASSGGTQRRARGECDDTDLPERVLYWAAAPRGAECSSQVSSAECAYGAYTNMGVASRDPDTGLYHIDIRSPQPYVTQGTTLANTRMWSRHLHFVAVDRACDTDTDTHTEKTSGGHHCASAASAWTVNVDTNRVHTLLVVPGAHTDMLFDYACTPLFDPRRTVLSPSLFIGFHAYMVARQRGAVCINAVKHEDWPPISRDDLVIPYKSRSSAIRSRVLHALRERNAADEERLQVLATQCGKGADKKEGALGLLARRPIVVYCVKASCEAAVRLLFKLDCLGFHNLFYLKHGIEEAREKLAELHPDMLKTLMKMKQQ